MHNGVRMDFTMGEEQDTSGTAERSGLAKSKSEPALHFFHDLPSILNLVQVSRVIRGQRHRKVVNDFLKVLVAQIAKGRNKSW